jgi:hypothetical protein
VLTGYDSSTASDCPSGGDFYLAYLNGNFTNYGEMQALHPDRPVLSITVYRGVRANIGDCENGDLSPQQAADDYKAGLIESIYSNRSTYPSVLSFVGRPFPWYAADPSGTPHLLPGSIATQWAWPGRGSPGHYDISIAPNLNTFRPPSPPIVAPKENNMIARNGNVPDSYWCVRPSGDVYAFNAPYLGPLPKYLQAWGIGTTSVPVVGIVDDGAGGYVLEADNGAYPGSPALYRIPADGRFAR